MSSKWPTSIRSLVYNKRTNEQTNRNKRIIRITFLPFRGGIKQNRNMHSNGVGRIQWVLILLFQSCIRIELARACVLWIQRARFHALCISKIDEWPIIACENGGPRNTSSETWPHWYIHMHYAIRWRTNHRPKSRQAEIT